MRTEELIGTIGAIILIGSFFMAFVYHKPPRDQVQSQEHHTPIRLVPFVPIYRGR